MSRADKPLPTEEYRELYTPNYATRGKPQKPPTAGAFDTPLLGCCINADWMMHILGSTASLEWRDAWEGTPEEKQFALDQIIRIQDSMTCQCGCIGTSIIRNTITESFRFQLRLEFEANSLIGVAPDMPDTFFDEDSGDDFGEAERRRIALCWACADYVNTVFSNILDFLQDTGQDLGIVLIPAALTIGLIAGVATLVAVTVIQHDLMLLFNQESTRRDIACCMFEGLSGQAITQANFEASLSACGFTVPSVKDAIRELTEETLNDQGNFLSFVKSLGAYFNVTDILAACQCDPMVETCNFTIDECGFQPQDGGPGLLATYDEGLGWDNGPGGAVNHVIAITRPLPVATSFSAIKIFNVNTLGMDNVIYSFKLFDIDDNVLLTDSIEVASSQTSHQFTFTQVDDVREVECRIARTGLLLDFPGHMTAVQVVADPPPFPEQ